MQSRKYLAQTALKQALSARLLLNISIENAFCVYDYTEKLGIEVKFVDIPSMEGMYLYEPKETIIITSHRPQPRQRYTCAHEIGHHHFNHSIHIDDTVENHQSRIHGKNEEMLADLFAGFFLMPRTTVLSGFKKRGIDYKSCSPFDFYRVASWLGVGYSTLVNHMRYSLKMMPSYRADQLSKSSPKKIRKYLFGHDIEESIVPIDSCWCGRPIDLFVGELIIAPKDVTHDGKNLQQISTLGSYSVFEAIEPGIARLFIEDMSWSSFVRISREAYVGRSIFRHLEEV